MQTHPDVLELRERLRPVLRQETYGRCFTCFLQVDSFDPLTAATAQGSERCAHGSQKHSQSPCSPSVGVPVAARRKARKDAACSRSGKRSETYSLSVQTQLVTCRSDHVAEYGENSLQSLLRMGVHDVSDLFGDLPSGTSCDPKVTNQCSSSACRRSRTR